MYQVIYSSVVVWCAILSYMFMGRLLAKLQWFAIFGTSMGLTLCALENMNQPASSKLVYSLSRFIIFNIDAL